MLKKVKDSALSKGIRFAINSYMKRYGKMLKFNLDSENKRMMLEVLLDGEKEPLSIRIERYVLTEENGKNVLKLYGIRTSRSWINTVADTYLEGKAFEIPKEYAKILQMIV